MANKIYELPIYINDAYEEGGNWPQMEFWWESDVDLHAFVGYLPTNGSTINMYSFYHANSGVVEMYFTYDTDDSSTIIDYEPDPKEFEFLVNKMQEYCLEVYGMTMEEHMKKIV